MSDKSGPEEAIEGVVEGVKGKVKEVAGAVAGRDDLMREGQAQQDKADAQREAAQKECRGRKRPKGRRYQRSSPEGRTVATAGGGPVTWGPGHRRCHHFRYGR